MVLARLTIHKYYSSTISNFYVFHVPKDELNLKISFWTKLFLCVGRSRKPTHVKKKNYKTYYRSARLQVLTSFEQFYQCWTIFFINLSLSWSVSIYLFLIWFSFVYLDLFQFIMTGVIELQAMAWISSACHYYMGRVDKFLVVNKTPENAHFDQMLKITVQNT